MKYWFLLVIFLVLGCGDDENKIQVLEASDDPYEQIIMNEDGIDNDGDGFIDEEDCDESSTSLQGVDADSDCDGVEKNIDCDDSDPLNTMSNENDKDCDAIPTDIDCDDSDADITNTNEKDRDCDLFQQILIVMITIPESLLPMKEIATAMDFKAVWIVTTTIQRTN